MKICILSMQHVLNFGSLLQSYALKTMLQEMGHTVFFLNIIPNKEDNCLLEGFAMEYPEEMEKHGTISSKLKKLDRYTRNRLQHKFMWVVQSKYFQKFQHHEFPTADTAEFFDCCVIGSDEVFNCLSPAPWGFTSQLFGNVPQADKVITYAASCGSTVFSAVPSLAVERIREALKNVCAISVRDQNTRDFVSHCTNTAIQEHLDPVLVYDFDREIAEAALPADLPNRYCIIYSYYNRIHKETDIRQIQAFCREQDLEPVTVGAPQKWIAKHLVLSPFEALKVFQNAAFVITDTFHGTIFSAKYAKRFAVMVQPSNRNKLEDLIRKLALEQHVIQSFEQLKIAGSAENDLNRIALLTKKEQMRTIQYLKENITGMDS